MTPDYEAELLDHARRLTTEPSPFLAQSVVDLVSDLAGRVTHYRQEYQAMRDRWMKAHPPESWTDDLMVLQIRHQLSHTKGKRRRRDGPARAMASPASRAAAG